MGECVQAPIARRFAPNVCSALAPPGACSQATITPLQSCSSTYSMQHLMHIRAVRTRLLPLLQNIFPPYNQLHAKSHEGNSVSPVKAKRVTCGKVELSHPPFSFHSGKKDQNHLQQIQAKYEDRNVLMAKFGPTMANSPAVGQFSQMSPMKISVFLEIRGFSLI